MPAFSPEFLVTATGGRWTSRPSGGLTGFNQDTRRLQAGQVFVALRTGQRDGHDFLAAARQAGAGAALVARADEKIALPQLVVADPLAAFQAIAAAHRRSATGPVIGVTGSCGKTSTKNLLSALLGGPATVLSTEGNLNNHLGVPLTLTRLEPERHRCAVVEAGIGAPGDMEPLGRMIAPDHAIVTLVAPAHTEALGGLEGVAREKVVLLHHVRGDGLRVFPAQCATHASFCDLPGNVLVLTPVGERAPAARRVLRFAVEADDQTSQLILDDGRRFTFRRVSAGMAQNAALAVALASELGVDDAQMQRVLAAWQPAQWRGELRNDGQRWLYLDFYNANPASMLDALANFHALAPAAQPRLFVLGGMGELGPEAPRYHRELGQRLALRPSDRAYVIGDCAEDVRTGWCEAGGDAGAVAVVSELAKIAAAVAAFSGAVFVKGSRRYQLEKVIPGGTEAATAVHH